MQIQSRTWNTGTLSHFLFPEAKSQGNLTHVTSTQVILGQVYDPGQQYSGEDEDQEA